MTLTLEFPECGDSTLGRLDPRWKLAALVPAALATALLRTLGPAVAALLGALILVVLTRLPLRWYLAHIGVAALFLGLFFVWIPLLATGEPMLSLGLLSISQPGLILATVLLVRALAMITLGLVLLASSPVQDTFKAARALYVPALIVQVALLAYRYVFLLADEMGRLRIALRVRGYCNRPSLHSYRTIGQVAGTLLVRGHERAERIGQAMRCRGFDGAFRSLHDFSTCRRDVAAWGVILAWSAALLAWDVWMR